MAEDIQEPIDSELLSRDNIVLRETITNSRVIIMSCSAYRSMCDALFDQFKSGAGVILYRMGEGYSKKLFGAVPKLGMTNEEVISGFERLAYLAGWGKINLQMIDSLNAECVVEKCAFVLRRGDIGQTSCYFFSGILSALASELLKREYRTMEMECEASGSAFCKFKVEAI